MNPCVCVCSTVARCIVGSATDPLGVEGGPVLDGGDDDLVDFLALSLAQLRVQHPRVLLSQDVRLVGEVGAAAMLGVVLQVAPSVNVEAAAELGRNSTLIQSRRLNLVAI